MTAPSAAIDRGPSRPPRRPETPLRRHRRARAMSTRALADRVGVHPNSLLRWERLERLPGPQHLHLLATSLGVSAPEAARWFDPARRSAESVPSVRGVGLRALRHAVGVPVADLAEVAGVPASHVYNWESGRARIPAERLPALAVELGLTEADLREHLGRATAAPVATPRVAPHPLRRLRQRARMSQAAAAVSVGVARHTLAGWERGRRPPLHALRGLASAYGVSVSVVASACGVAAPRELDVRTWRPGDLPRVLRVLRLWSGLTQDAVASACGCSRSAVRSWEAARGTPTRRTLTRLEQLHRLPAGCLVRLRP